MRIANSNISMFAQHDYLQEYAKKESLKMWVGDERPDFEGTRTRTMTSSADPSGPVNQDALIKLSEQAKASSAAPAGGLTDENDGLSAEDRVKVRLIEAMLSALTGKDIKIRIMKPIQTSPANIPANTPTSSQAGQSEGQKREGWGVEYDYHESYIEKEKMSFDAEGVIKTADGKEIKFNASLNMSREFMLQNNINFRAGDAKKIDPLVINFDNNGTRLTTAKFSFDLDSNGKDERISFAGPGSGFLAIDLNSDGVINNGKELFGPNTGNGFKELSRYDNDSNGWIDEADTIYNALRIWTKDAKGNNALNTLKDKNIGAVYLGNITARFDIKDSDNVSNGEIIKAGIYLKDNGHAGTIQQVNLVA